MANFDRVASAARAAPLRRAGASRLTPPRRVTQNRPRLPMRRCRARRATSDEPASTPRTDRHPVPARFRPARSRARGRVVSRRAGGGLRAGAGRVSGRPVGPARDQVSAGRVAVPARDRRPDLRVERRDRGRRGVEGAAALRRRGRSAALRHDRAELAPVGSRLGRDQAPQHGARRRGCHRRRRAARRGGLRRDGAHPHVHRSGRRLDLLPRGAVAVPRRGARPLAHPLALRHDRLRRESADRAREPAGLRQLPLVLERRQRARPRRRLRQRQGRLRRPARLEEGDGARRREDHHLERLPARRRRHDLRAAVAGLAGRSLRDQHREGPRGVRRDARHPVLAVVLPGARHPGRVRPRDRRVQAVAGRRRPGVRAEQPDLEP